jgi:hypothetical protein
VQAAGRAGRATGNHSPKTHKIWVVLFTSARTPIMRSDPGFAIRGLLQVFNFFSFFKYFLLYLFPFKERSRIYSK